MPQPLKTRFYLSSGRLAVASNGTTLVTIYTATNTSIQNPDGSAGNGGRLIGVCIYNADTIPHGYTIHMVPSGGTAGVNTVRENMPVNSIQPGEVQYFVPPVPLPFTDGDFVQVKMLEAVGTVQMQFTPFVSEMAA